MKCQMEHLGVQCIKEATWKVRFLEGKKKNSFYFCDACSAMLAQYDSTHGNQFDGERIDVEG